MHEVLILLIAFFILIFLNVPIAFSLCFLGSIALIFNGFDGKVVIRQLYNGLDSFSIMAVPFFLFAGALMGKGGITTRILDISSAIVGRLRGGLGHVNIVASMLFAGISGAAVSDAAALGGMLIPGMVKKGYSPEYGAAVTAASSMLGPIIPPSITLVIFGGVMGVSIGGLFAAGLIPGVALGIVQMITHSVIIHKRGFEEIGQNENFKNNYTSINNVNERISFVKNTLAYFQNIFSSLKKGYLAVFMLVIIFGGILGGVFTPTEAASVAAVYALIITLIVSRTISIKEVGEMLKNDVVPTTGMIMLIIGAASIISHYLAITNVPKMVGILFYSLTGNAYIFMILVSITLLILGTFLSLHVSVVILGPILTPIAMEYGISPIQFGLLFVFALNTAMITPPVGSVLYIVAGIAKINFLDVVKEILPYYLSFIVVIIIIIFYEPFTLFIPKLFGFI
jgi:tripartite ATP-independent transporter DctM subunit